MIKNLRHTAPIVLIAAICSLFLTQRSDAFSSAAPTGRTGAPGGTVTCANCHTGSPGEGSVGISVTNGNEYTPGQMIELMVTVADPTRVRWGFSMVARDTDNNTVDVGSWVVSNPADTGVNGTHVGHVNAPFNTANYTFTVNWTPPATGVGEVTFYAVGNAANGVGSSGDKIYFTNLTISEAVADPTPATLTDLFREPDGTSKFTLTGGATETYTVEFSNNLKDWDFLETRTLGSASEIITDTGAVGETHRYYRATPGTPDP